jgi:hypothetical protein
MRPKKAIPTKQLSGPLKDRARALQRLRENWEAEVEHEEGEEFNPSLEPIITPLLKAVDGGIPSVISSIRAYDDDEARDFISLHDSLSLTDRKKVSLEEIAYASGIGSLRLAEIAQTAVFLSGKMLTSLLVSSNMPKVVKASIAQAIKPKGLADRQWMLKAGGVLPMPKGAQIAIQNNIQPTSNSSQGDNEKNHAEWLYPDERLRKLNGILEGDNKSLPSPSTPLPIGGVIDHIQSTAASIIDADYSDMEED